MNLWFTRLFRLMWLFFFILLIFLDRDLFTTKIGLIAFIFILTAITILRALESKKEWGKIVKEMNSDDQELFKS